MNLFNEIWFGNLIKTIIVIIISTLIYNILISILFKNVDNNKSKLFTSNRSKTFAKLFKNIFRYVFFGIVILVILHINGINITSMLAGVGIIGIIVGFAIQDALKDIIKGFDIISDNYYQVGDVIKYGEIEGKVLAIGLKTTKIKDVKSFNVISISNRNIEQVEVVSNLINIDVPLPYEIKVNDSEIVINKIVDSIKKLKNVDNCEYRGVNDLADSCIKYQIKVYCAPINKVQLRRDALRCILLGLEEANIQVPYNQIDVHQK